MLRTKSILAAILPEDGKRISVMSRHTLSDGVTADERITDPSFDEHWSLLAPSAKLIGDYYKRGLPWDEFEEQFKKELESEEKVDCLEQLIAEAQVKQVTILCIEDTPQHCHRRLIAEICQKLEPTLQVLIK